MTNIHRMYLHTKQACVPVNLRENIRANWRRFLFQKGYLLIRIEQLMNNRDNFRHV